jgi:hypothetical protein
VAALILGEGENPGQREGQEVWQCLEMSVPCLCSPLSSSLHSVPTKIATEAKLLVEVGRQVARTYNRVCGNREGRTG